MFEYMHELSQYAPLMVGVASFLDIFFITGYILYGGATLGVVAMMLMKDMITVPELFIAAVIGTIIGNQVNYWIGRGFNTTQFVERRLSTPRAQKAEVFLRSRGLLLYMLIGCFITFFRPIHGLILGAFNIRWRRFFLYDIFISTVWISFWIFVLLYGEHLYLKFFG